MIYEKFYINKATNTSADTLLALGFADLTKLVLKKRHTAGDMADRIAGLKRARQKSTTRLA